MEIKKVATRRLVTDTERINKTKVIPEIHLTWTSQSGTLRNYRSRRQQRADQPELQTVDPRRELGVDEAREERPSS